MFTRVQASAWTDNQTNNSLKKLLLLTKLLLKISLLVAAKLLLGELLEAAKLLLKVGTLLGKLGDTSLGTVHGSGTKLLEALAEAAKLLTVAVAGAVAGGSGELLTVAAELLAVAAELLAPM